MAKIKKFEDIESWKKARKLTKEVYDFDRAVCERFRSERSDTPLGRFDTF